MAPFYQTTPRKDGKTQEEVDAAMTEHLNTYYIQEEDRIVEGAGNTSVAPPAPVKPKAKQPARKKSNTSSDKAALETSQKSDDVQSSPATRKSARVASKRAAAEAADAEDDQEQPPKKRYKISPTEKAATSPKEVTESPPAEMANSSKKLSRVAGSKRDSSESEVSDENDQNQPAIKKYKISPPEDTTASSSKSSASATARKTRSAISKELPKAKNIQKKPSVSDTADEDDSATETESDDDNAEDEDATANKGRKAKGKKPAVKAFEGTKSGFGTSLEKPDDAPLTKPWKCANRDCNSGQTYHLRDGPNSYGRKVISNFFGRNKKETNLIHADVWHNYCRKCYQRGTYRVNVISNLEKVKYYISNIDMQLDRIQLWRPEATFTVQLSKGANTRLAKYYKEVTKPNATTASAQAAVTKTPQTNSKGKVKPLTLEDGFPIDLLQHFEDNYVGNDQSFTDIKLILNWITNLAENRQIDCMPPMEFLINKLGAEEEIVDHATNYERWCAHEDGAEYEEDDAGVVAEAPGKDANQNVDAGEQANATDADENEDVDRDSKQAGYQYEQRVYDGDDEPEDSSESDEEIKEAVKLMSEDYIGRLTGGATGPSTPPPAFNTDFYEDDEETDEDEEDDEPVTPPPHPRKFQLTPTGIGAPIEPGQSSTYYVNRDAGVVDFSHKRKRSYADDAAAARSLLALKSSPRAQSAATPNQTSANNVNQLAAYVPPAARQFTETNYNDTSSEGGDESPSKKRKL